MQTMKYGREHLEVLELAAKLGTPIFTEDDFTEIFRLARLGVLLEQNKPALRGAAEFELMHNSWPKEGCDDQTSLERFLEAIKP